MTEAVKKEETVKESEANKSQSDSTETKKASSKKRVFFVLWGREITWKELVIMFLLIFGGFVAFKFVSKAQFFGKYKEERNSGVIASEKRTSFSSGNIEAKINRNSYRENRGESGTAIMQKRNLSSEITVFLAQEKEKKEEKLSEDQEMKSKTGKKLGLPSGTKVRAYTQGTIFSYNVEAPVSVIVSHDIKKDDEVVIPKNSKFLGKASILKSLNRINVSFHRLIFPDGREMTVKAIALAEDGSSGIPGKVSKHTDKKILKGVGETLLGGVSLFTSGFGTDVYSPQDRLRENLAENLLDEARGDLRSEKIETSVTVPSLTSVEVLLVEGL